MPEATYAGEGCTIKAGGAICGDESVALFQCAEEHYYSKNAASTCAGAMHTFDKCTDAWRKEVGPKVKIRGSFPMQPPVQCQPVTCLIQECLANNHYKHDKCEYPMSVSKHCITKFYGSPYVID